MTPRPAIRRPAVRLPRAARRQQVLQTAQQVFVEQGYHAAGMDEIAERAGVSKPVLYQHFPGKLELYLALLDDNVARLERAVRSALASTSDNNARVTAAIAAYVDFVDDEAGTFRLVFESDLSRDPAVAERVERGLQASIEAVAAVIAEDTGLSGAEGELLACGLTGLAQVSARWWLHSGERLAKDRAIELLAGLAWRGLAGFPRAE
jgi:AcrR family transcriptional regulator